MSLVSSSAGCLIIRSCVSLLRSLTLDWLQNPGGSIPLLFKASRRQYRTSKPRPSQVTMILARLKLKWLLSSSVQEYGARPLRRAITRIVDDALSDAILNGALADGDVAYVDIDAAGTVSVSNVQPDSKMVFKSEIVDSTLLKRRNDAIVNA